MAKKKKEKIVELYKDLGLVNDPNTVVGTTKKNKLTKKKRSQTKKFVDDLEKEANKPQKKKFKFGKVMCEELEYYMQKYGDNYEAMARDKRNIYQDSPGQLRYKILKYTKSSPTSPNYSHFKRWTSSQIKFLIMAPYTTYFSELTCRLSAVCRSLSERRIVSKPSLLSRLRYVDIVKNQNETKHERAYRIQYEELQDWNNKYWTENNELFQREKDNFIRENFGSTINSDEALSHDKLAPFYRDFLERNRRKHVEYNTIWYRNYLSLLNSAVIAKMSRIRANLCHDIDR